MDISGLYYVDIRDVEACAGFLSERMPSRHFERMQAYRKKEDRLRFLSGWFLLAHFLEKQGIADEALQYGIHGKPNLPHGPCFNLSHSGNFVVFASDTHPIGIDVEMWRLQDYEKLAGACFHPEEILQLKKVHDTPRAFFDLWVLKESYVKMLGCGVSRKFSSFCITVQENRAFLKENSEAPPFFRLYSLFPEYSLSLCSHRENWPETFLKLNPCDILFS